MSTNATEVAGSRPYFGRLETLRGLGAMAIAGYHFSGCALHRGSILPHHRWAEAGIAWHDAGWMRYLLGRIGLALLPAHAFLMIFFVISGFVLREALAYGPRTISAAGAKFFLGRLFRIYPIVIFGMILTAVLMAMGSDPVFVTPGRLVRNLLLFDVSLNTTLWALQVELLMAPVILGLFFLERRWGPIILVIVALTGTGLAFVPSWAGWPPLSTNLFSFALGMTIPTLGRRFATGLSKFGATVWVLGSVAVLLSTGPCFGIYSRYSTICEAYAALGLVSIVAYRLDIGLLKWLDFVWLKRLGMASGSYYVLHMATIPIVLGFAPAIIPMTWTEQAPVAVGVGFLALWLVALAPLMMGISNLIEMPGIALGRRVVRSLRLDSRPHGQPVAKSPVKQAA